MNVNTICLTKFTHTHNTRSRTQLATSDVGHTTMALFAVRTPFMPCRSTVSSSVMDCSVLPAVCAGEMTTPREER